MKCLAVAFALVGFLLPAPSARAAGPAMLIGAAEDSVRQSTLREAKAEMDLLVRAGFNAVRVTQVWAPGETEPSATDLRILRNVVEAGRLDRMKILITVMNFGNRTTPLTDQAQGEFASYAAALAQALPQVRYFVIGNEPNINRYWLPQFNPDGTDAAAPAYEALLARTYDALKAVSPKIVVLGGAISPRGGDNSSVAPAAGVHPNSTTIALADYDKLVALLGRVFDGTAQRGSTLPIYYDEFGVETQIPPAKASLYTGVEPATIKPVPEDVQAEYYRQAVELAFCQPTVRALLIFHTIDEPDLNRWQSGLFYVDDKPKASLISFRRAAAEARRGVVAQCPDLKLRPRVTLLRAAATPRPAVTFRCDLDCEYVLTARHGKSVVTRRGRAIGNGDKRVLLGSLR